MGEDYFIVEMKYFYLNDFIIIVVDLISSQGLLFT